MITMKNFLKISVSAIFIPLFTYLSQTTYLFDFLQKNNYITVKCSLVEIQDFCLVISIVLTFIFIVSQYGFALCKYDKFLKQRNALLKVIKTILVNALESEFKKNGLHFEIRLFLPQHRIWYWFADFFKLKHRIIYHIKNLSVWADVGKTKKLSFEVKPQSQGLVGMCFSEKNMVYDSNLKVTNKTNYKLSKLQLDQTSDLRFIVCCPILGPEPKEKVVAILAFDTKAEINLTPKQIDNLRDPLYTFSRQVYEAVPELFR
jgi:hypothetical protein